MLAFLSAWSCHLKWRHVFSCLNVNIVHNDDVQEIMAQWTILQILGLSLRVHIFYRDDPEHFHSHPRGFASIGICGAYLEEMTNGRVRWVTPGTLTIRRARDAHRVSPVVLPCITVAITTPVIRQWERLP